jgi:hypothetical protein
MWSLLSSKLTASSNKTEEDTSDPNNRVDYNDMQKRESKATVALHPDGTDMREAGSWAARNRWVHAACLWLSKPIL